RWRVARLIAAEDLLEPDMDGTLLLDTPVNQQPLGAGDDMRRASGADVLVVIPTLNEAAHIDACVRSLMAGDDRLGLIDLVVADGGSRDRTRSIVAELRRDFPNLRLIDNPQRLQSAAVNLAAKQAGPGRHILVRCDAHSIYPSGYIMQVAD